MIICRLEDNMYFCSMIKLVNSMKKKVLFLLPLFLGACSDSGESPVITIEKLCEAEIIVILIFTETVDVYLNIGSGVCDGIVHQVTENGVEQRVIAFDLDTLL